MSKPRTPSFGAKQRSRLARRAATARWARLGRGVLTLAEIRAAVVKALAERETKLAPGGAGIPRGLGFLPEPPAPAGSEAEAPGKRKRKPRAYLFDSYGRGDASARDEIYILVIMGKLPEDLLGEIADLTSAIDTPWATTAGKSSCTCPTRPHPGNGRGPTAPLIMPPPPKGSGLSKLIGVLADIHGELQALDAALGRLRGMGCDLILCAGDLIDMEPFGEEVVQRLKSEKDLICILGNHERWALDRRHRQKDMRSFFEPCHISEYFGGGAELSRIHWPGWQPCPALGSRAGGRSRGDVARTARQRHGGARRRGPARGCDASCWSRPTPTS